MSIDRITGMSDASNAQSTTAAITLSKRSVVQKVCLKWDADTRVKHARQTRASNARQAPQIERSHP